MLQEVVLLILACALGGLLARSLRHGGKKKARSWWFQGVIPLALVVANVPGHVAADPSTAVVVLLAAAIGLGLGTLRIVRPGLEINRAAGLIEVRATVPMVTLWLIVFLVSIIANILARSAQGDAPIENVMILAQTLLGAMMFARTAAVYWRYFTTPVALT